MRPLLALLVFVPSLCLAQVPTYVPTEDLVAWYPMNNSGNDSSGNGFDGEVIGSTFTTDRFGAEASSAYFDWAEVSGYGNPWQRIEINPGFDGYLEGTFSVAAWINPEHYYWPQNNAHGAMIFGYASRCPNTAGLRFSIEGEGALRLRWGNNAISQEGAIALNEWQHVVGTIDTDSMRVYINGIQVGSAPAIAGPTSGCFNIGELHQANGHWYYFDGAIDDLGVWNAALTDQEIAALFSGAPPLSGCSDPEACNYDPEATADDGSCTYGCLYCGENTIWDDVLQACVGVIPPDTPSVLTPSCGAGTVWDPVNEECIIAIPTDNNLDGCISAGDVLNLLSTFGTCPPYPEWPDESVSPCQDSTSIVFGEHSYALVQIAGRCWFSENLRTQTYQNGDTITSDLTGSEWGAVTEGAVHFVSDSSAGLYNTESIFDPRGLCPSGWHVATDLDWLDLEVAVGMSTAESVATGARGSIANELKASPSHLSNWQGTGAFGFALMPDGRRTNSFGTLLEQGTDAYYWMGDTEGPGMFTYRRLMSNSEAIIRANNGGSPRAGFSVLCVAD